ncbi:Ser-Thr-rich glycosyl-phosphatidyl-inositol-anchored membrane family-domain-containing protein [Xylaria sp. FL0064]|nr:Ser-Thr-rich glycosyl-phosphatidyl-inositol-anchored membrane family-domain-containing protein [Xylaria sp. FL0064]
MRSSTIIASVLAFAASALAQDATPGYAVVSAPGEGEIVPAGKTYTITWSAGKFSGPATISLLAGATPQTLQVTDAIANDVEVKTGSFSWKVDCSLGEDKTYGLKIADKASGGATFQYSFPFEIKGPSCDSTTSTSVSTSASETGYVTISLSASTSGYPTTSITASTSASAYPTKGSNSTTSATVSYTTSSYSNSTMTKATSTASTLTTYSTPVVIVTETSAATGSASSTPATSTTASSPVPTAGAARAGAGLALGLIAAALAL